MEFTVCQALAHDLSAYWSCARWNLHTVAVYMCVCNACFLPLFYHSLAFLRRCNGTATCFCVSNRNGQTRTHTSSILVCRFPTATTEIITTVVHQLAVEMRLRFLWPLPFFSLPFFLNTKQLNQFCPLFFKTYAIVRIWLAFVFYFYCFVWMSSTYVFKGELNPERNTENHKKWRGFIQLNNIVFIPNFNWCCFFCRVRSLLKWIRCVFVLCWYDFSYCVKMTPTIL